LAQESRDLHAFGEDGRKRMTKAAPIRSEMAKSASLTEIKAAITGFVGHGFWRLERAGGALSWSDSLPRPGGELVVHGAGQDALLAVIHGDDQAGFVALLAAGFESGLDHTQTLRFVRPDGSWRMVSNHAKAQKDEAGTVSAISGVLVDVTEVEICRLLFEEGGDIISQTDGCGVITYVSASVERITGFAPAALVGRPLADLVGAQTAAAMQDAVRSRWVDGQRPEPIVHSLERADRRGVWLESRLIATIDPASGQRVGATHVMRDISRSKEVEARLEHANIMLKTLMESSPSGIILADETDRITSFNHTFAEMWDVPAADLASGDYQRVLDGVSALLKDGFTARRRMEEQSRETGKPAQEQVETNDGRWIDRYTVPFHTPGRGCIGQAWFFRDITDHRHALSEAVRMARYDDLTGLANRGALVDALERAIAQTRRRERSFAILYLDLDDFKDVNDTQGHLLGDQLLVAVADRLRLHLRESDTIARLGGDEFAILVSDLRTATDAAILADQLIRIVGEPYQIEGHQIFTSVSIGIDLFGPDAADTRTLLSHADLALYQAKSAGAGSYRFFTEAMDSEVRTRVTLATELREAIEAGQLFLVYQPEVDLDSGHIVGAEALVRWRHPRRGILGPELFVPIAEQMGLIGALGRWVLRTAARQAARWSDGGLGGVRMGVNVSALQLKAPAALEADIAATLAETGLAPSLLELELTETALMTASEGGDILTRLNQAGVKIAIDDFGTGYSSLDYLRRFPAGRIKIAQTFVRHIGDSPGDRAIVRATIGLAREMGMTAIAEGIETPAQLDALKAWGCAEGQGFLFDRPLSADDATRRLAAGGYGRLCGVEPAVDPVEPLRSMERVLRLRR
jgi:diguanylate cyclase (GGDEF)-like protein/PAS domain S-box-containing protein